MTDAQQTITQLFGQTEERCLHMFAEAIRKAHKSGRNKWGVTLYNNDRVRLNVGSVVVCTLHAGGIWFALDKDFGGTLDESYLDRAHDCWNWTHEHDYRAVPSISGYYKPSTARKHAATWPRIRKMHFALIDNAADKYKRLRKTSQTAHSSEFLKYLRNRLKQPDIPNPVY